MYQTKKENRNYQLVNWYCEQMFGCPANVATHVLTRTGGLDYEAALTRLLVEAREYLHGFCQDACVTACIRIAEKKRMYKRAPQATTVSRYICGKRQAFARYQSK